MWTPVPTAEACAPGVHSIQVHVPRKVENLRVLPKDLSGKAVARGMKHLSKGLGVECAACHVKGEWASDANANKELARRFLSSTLREKDSAKRTIELAVLVKALGRPAAEDESDVWDAIDDWADDD